MTERRISDAVKKFLDTLGDEVDEMHRVERVTSIQRPVVLLGSDSSKGSVAPGERPGRFVGFVSSHYCPAG